jgi:GTP-binding protein
VWAEHQGGRQNLADLLVDGEQIVVAEGGKGGAGNARFATSTNQAPRISERGLPGERRSLRLELRLLADVGLVGMPNAGKSSLLGAMTSANPKVGTYAFTTLEPQLGVVEVGHERFVLADIPGLVSGAAEGRGLGTEFLRQIERTAALLFVVDGARDDPAEDLDALQAEIREYGRGLADKESVVTINKSDLLDERGSQSLLDELAAQGGSAFLVSAKTGQGLDDLAKGLLTVVQRARSEGKTGGTPVVLHPPEMVVEARKDGDKYRIVGERAEREAARLGVSSGEARRELWRRLARMGALRALRRVGARPGDIVKLGESELELPG